jgi:hypothetical protein
LVRSGRLDVSSFIGKLNDALSDNNLTNRELYNSIIESIRGGKIEIDSSISQRITDDSVTGFNASELVGNITSGQRSFLDGINRRIEAARQQQ